MASPTRTSSYAICSSMRLDHPVAEYRSLLNAWVKKREEGKKIDIYTDAPEYIDWPMLEKLVTEEKTADGRVVKIEGWDFTLRRDALAREEKVTGWQRPMQSTLKGDYHLLANGKLLDSV